MNLVQQITWEVALQIIRVVGIAAFALVILMVTLALTSHLISNKWESKQLIKEDDFLVELLARYGIYIGMGCSIFYTFFA